MKAHYALHCLMCVLQNVLSTYSITMPYHHYCYCAKYYAMDCLLYVLIKSHFIH